jgi:ketosteroid isomerase-like protein
MHPARTHRITQRHTTGNHGKLRRWRRAREAFDRDASAPGEDPLRSSPIFRVSAIRTISMVLLAVIPMRNPIAIEIATPAKVPVAAVKAIEAANNEWLPSMERQDAKTLAEPYDEDAVFVTRSGQSVLGQEAIRRFYLESFRGSRKVVGGSLVQDGLIKQGEFIVEWGHARVESRQNGEAPASRLGSYMTVWHCNQAGLWKITRNLSL